MMSMRCSHRTTVSMGKPVSFWQGKLDTVIILVQGFASLFVLWKVTLKHKTAHRWLS